MAMNAHGRFLLLILGSLLFTGCSLMNRYDYSDQTPEVKTKGSLRIAIAALDVREYVANRQKRPRFTGLFRSGFGIPYDITTASGKPMADEFAAAMQRALTRNGFSVIPVPTQHTMRAENVLAKAVATGADRILLLSIFEWKGETFGVTRVYYNLSLDVYDGKGASLGSKDLSGSDFAGGRFLEHVTNPLQHAKDQVPVEFSRKIAELIDSPEIAGKLHSGGGNAVPETPANKGAPAGQGTPADHPPGIAM